MFQSVLQCVLQSETIRAISAFLGVAVRCSVLQYVAECVALCVAERDYLCDICMFVQINIHTCIYLARSADISYIMQMNICMYVHIFESQKLACSEAIVCMKVECSLRMLIMEASFQISIGTMGWL